MVYILENHYVLKVQECCMSLKFVSPFYSVSPQILVSDVERIAELGYKTIINNRPDKESDDQPSSADIKAEAERLGLKYLDIPITPGNLTDDNIASFSREFKAAQSPTFAFCRTGTRSITLWALDAASHLDVNAILNTTKTAGYDLERLRPKLEQRAQLAKKAIATDLSTKSNYKELSFDVVIVGGGSAGIAVASSLINRRTELEVAIIEPRERHYYQPGFTLLGGGVFNKSDVVCATSQVMPDNVQWIKTAASVFEPKKNGVILEDGTEIYYKHLIVCPGLKLNWDAVSGLSETLGKNGVTSNYRFDLAPYTWELTSSLKSGRAIFTQPPMPIKCAGAPQKAMYLSSDHWFRNRVIKNIDVDFNTAGDVLFGVPEFVPALMEYVKKYDANLNFTHNLVEIDGAAKKAWFDIKNESGETNLKEVEFDMIHVCPPQTAPDFISKSPLANDAGWVEVNPDTLQHTQYENIFSLGDACSAPNAKTMAAARVQAPIVAANLLAHIDGRELNTKYDGYGACPLTVERGKIVLAEFGYGGKLLPTLPTWLIDGTKPSRLAWILKERLMPTIYYRLMLEGREWMIDSEGV